MIITTFLLSIQNLWFLATAGHCITDINKNIESGYKFRCRLLDSISLNAKYKDHSIPFDYNGAFSVSIDDFDYGLILVRKSFRRLLEANNVRPRPLDEKFWRKKPENADAFWLLGIPKTLNEFNNTHVKIVSTFHLLEPLSYMPKAFKKPNAPTFFAKITLSEDVTDIDGMSGGPIFSFKKMEDGKLKYWLHAIQSRWIKEDKYIAACLMQPFASYIKEKIISEI